MSGPAGIENFYDVPATEVLLSGGPWDGHRMFVPDGRTEWLMPPRWPAETIESMRARIALGPQTIMDKITVYSLASIREDGLRIFEPR